LLLTIYNLDSNNYFQFEQEFFTFFCFVELNKLNIVFTTFVHHFVRLFSLSKQLILKNLKLVLEANRHYGFIFVVTK